MTLASGARLGPYEILAPLGAGGMGEVYKAKDTRLERTVAIKVLPQRLSSSPEVRQRFEREAKTISQLSHSHICALYDVGREGETEYLVMEYLEGETLSERLAKGPLPLEATLRYGQEIADALDKAHRQGIVHRDLKPGNVMLTKSGVKLLDFGLAKAIAPPSPQASLTALPTQQGLTQEGTILGTFQYMAPEQLEGKEADARTDIFALGATLYEMATGKKAFSGTSQASLISSIMTADPPPISTIQPMSPPALDRVVKTCLAKDPEERWQSAGDVAKELRWISEGSATGLVTPAVSSRRRFRERMAWSAFAIAGITAAILAAALLRQARTRAVRPVRAFITAPEKTTFRFIFAGGPPALSPDGRKLVFSAATSGGRPLLWIRPLESLVAQPLPGTEDAGFPFWSPDGRFVGFFAGTKLKKIDVSGGPPVSLCEVPEGGRGGSWGRDHTILFSGRYTPVFRVSAAGGQPVSVTRLDQARKDATHRWPLWLPGGRRFLYLASEVGSESEANAILLASVDGKENRLLLNASSNTAYASGHLLFVREHMLMAQPFDEKGARFTGDPFPIAEVEYDALFSRGVFSVSDSGALVYQSGSASRGVELVWYDRAGKNLGSLHEFLRDVSSPARLSPDGKRVAVSISGPRSGAGGIWIYDIERAIKTRLTFDPQDAWPTWSPDGRRIAFTRRQQDDLRLFVKNSDGSGLEEALAEAHGKDNPTDWSADGKYIAFVRIEPPGKTREDIWILPLSGDRKPFPFAHTEFSEGVARFSPDGKWLAFASNESGNAEVYVAPFPGPGGKIQISTSGGHVPRWRRDGREIFYVAPDRKLMAAEVETSPSFRVGKVRPLFQTGLQAPWISYDPSADGQTFLLADIQSEEVSRLITLVLNWTSELKR
jgi:eukaryotic-like serine/threonine-protein kinase